MKNYIENLDKNFVVDFVRETFGDFKSRAIIYLKSEPNCYRVSFKIGNDKYGILFTNFCAICDDDKMSKSLTEKWRKELKNKFGKEYELDLNSKINCVAK